MQRTLARQTAALQPAAAPPAAGSAAQSTAAEAHLCILADDRDIAVARGEVRRQVTAAGMLAEPPLPASAAPERRAEHIANRLRDSRAALVLWASQDVVAVEDQLRMLRDWRALGRRDPFAVIALALLPPETEEKRTEDPRGPGELLIDLRAGVSAEALAPLVAAIGLKR